MFEEAFQVQYEPMNYSDPYYNTFRGRAYDFSVNQVLKTPYNLGAYLFYKMDRENHDY